MLGSSRDGDKGIHAMEGSRQSSFDLDLPLKKLRLNLEVKKHNS